MLKTARESGDPAKYVADLFNTGAFIAGIISSLTDAPDKQGSLDAVLADVTNAFNQGWEEANRQTKPH